MGGKSMKWEIRFDDDEQEVKARADTELQAWMEFLKVKKYEKLINGWKLCGMADSFRDCYIVVQVPE
jgi:hypothetical protein